MGLSSSYDYIIAGAGCAGLSLAVHGALSGCFKDKKVLLIDKEAKNTNDRTWCFWEKEEGLFQPIVKKTWSQLQFHSSSFSTSLHIAPYQYKLIRGIDFYTYCRQLLQPYSNITFHTAGVDRIFSQKGETGIEAEGKRISAQYLFNSILFEKPRLKKEEHWLLQHFKGWFIQTDQPFFDAAIGTLMDFRTDQQHGATFFYLLPFSGTEALVEYTLFSPHLLPEEAYDHALERYIKEKLRIESYHILEKEFGIIPMTNYPFPSTTNNIIHIGTAGGQTKGSSGYTFRFIQKHSAAIVQSLCQHGHPFAVEKASQRFRFYDTVLLEVLKSKRMEGAAVFTHLFKKNKPRQVLKFLDNETSLAEEVGLISTLPVLPFTRAAIKQLTR